MKRKLINPPGTERIYQSWQFSQAVRVGDTVWVSGQGGMGPDGMPESIHNLYYDDKRCARVKMDRDFYSRCKSIYDRYKCWTWTNQAPWHTGKDSCNVYAIKESSPDSVSKLLEVIGEQ